VIGIAGGWAFGILLQSRLFGIQANDPGTIAGSLTILMTVALLSS
jgi:hypothetical protein